jgi:beta-lactamase class A
MEKFCRSKFFILAIVILLASNFGMVFLFLSREGSARQAEFRTNFPLLDQSRGLYEQKDLIVNIQPLRDQLNEIGQDQNVSIYFEFLNTGANIAVNKDLAIWPASLMKIPIAMAAMMKVEKGEWRLDKEFTLNEEDKNSIFGELHRSPAGARFTLERLLDEILINSDNTARNIIVRNLSLQDFGDVVEHIGVDFDYTKDDQISAKRYSVIWRSLFNATYLSPENSQKLIQIMQKSSAKNFLARGIPEGIGFSHKIGVLFDELTVADSGIVYVPGRPYILVVMTQKHSQAEAEEIMRDVSQKVYGYVSGYK